MINAAPIDSVLDVIAKRIKDHSRPLNRTDHYKVGLVIEGGGMRGVVSGGMCVGLQALNAINAFDSIYGASAGAWAGAYFLADQADIGVTLYYQDLTTRFITLQPWRLLRGHPIMDTDYLVYSMLNQKRLDLDRIVSSEIPLHIYAACVEDECDVDFYPYKSKEDVVLALNCTPRIPGVTRSLLVEGKHYTDGCLYFGSLPIQKALEDGCTHVLVLLTRPQNSMLKTIKYPWRIHFLDRLVAFFVHKVFPGTHLDKGYLESYLHYHQALQLIKESEEGRLGGIALQAVELSDSAEIWRLETNPSLLRKGATMGFNKIMELFAPYNLSKRSEVKIIE